MGIGSRKFLLDRRNHLYRLSSAKFERMLAAPARNRLPQFAASRTRMTDITVELRNGRPIGVFRIAFNILTFNGRGILDSTAFIRDQGARARLAMARILPQPQHSGIVVDAALRFTDRGGRWKPTAGVLRLIEQAALGQVKCPRV
ncbi:MAG: hypothetical protein ACRET0_00200 [Steroidobacteraceae bacterium]